MNRYKITNKTNTLPKRNRKFNTSVSFTYVDKITKKIVEIKTGQTIFLTVPVLPLSVQMLRIKGSVIVEEISAAELEKLTKPKEVIKPKKQIKPKVELSKTKKENPKKVIKKNQ